MDISKQAKRRVRGYRTLAVTVIISANIAIGVLLFLHHTKQHVGNQPIALEARRKTLLAQIQQYNYQVAAVDPSLSIQTAQQGEVALGGTCDPIDANPVYRMRPAHELEAENPELAAKLKQHAKNNEIMLSLANGVMICQNTTICWWNGGNILESFLQIMERNSVTNYLIGVMDDETERYLQQRSTFVNFFRVTIQIPEAQKKSHPANQVSTIKYTLLKAIIQMGYNVLITDMDLVYFDNPFKHLYRDADIEIQTDGFDMRAYGEIGSIADKSMGWGGGGLYVTTFTANVGCMWVKANARSFKLMEQVSRHLLQQPGWDQQVFNEYLMRPAHGNFNSSFPHLRILDIDKWLNSKIFFRTRRSEYLPGASSRRPTPVMVHMNYHPDKHKRMLCLMDRYFDNKIDACDNFPGGSEPGT